MKTYTLIQLDTQSPNNSQWVSINDSGEFLHSVRKGNISEIDTGNKQNSVIKFSVPITRSTTIEISKNEENSELKINIHYFFFDYRLHGSSILNIPGL